MKIKNKPTKWEQEPWHVCRVESNVYGKKTAIYWYAHNMKTGEQKAYRNSYDDALKDCPTSPNAEPWGV